jgi:hypothetical protein
LGLRSSKSDGQPPPPVAAPTLTQPSAALAPVPVPTAKPAPTVDKARVVQQATTAINTHKKSLVEKCLAPSLAKKPDPPNVKYIFNITFDAAGNILARGVVEDRATSRPDVLQCVSDNFPALHIESPGQTVLVDVPLELP